MYRSVLPMYDDDRLSSPRPLVIVRAALSSCLCLNTWRDFPLATFVGCHASCSLSLKQPQIRFLKSGGSGQFFTSNYNISICDL